MITYQDAKDVLDNFNKETGEWVKHNTLTELPDYHELNKKETLGTHYRLDQIYYEHLTKYKSTYFALQSFFTNMQITASREENRNITNILAGIQQKIKEIDTLLDAGKHRLQFYKTVVYMVGNVIYGVE